MLGSAPEYMAPTWPFASVENAEYFIHGLETIFKAERTTPAQVVIVECFILRNGLGR